jgi:hypothetical protein
MVAAIIKSSLNPAKPGSVKFYENGFSAPAKPRRAAAARV